MADHAIIFGSIGAIVETSAMQREAFNKAFEEAGVDWNWSVDIYTSLLQTSCGERRIRDYAETTGIDVNAIELHQRTNELFGVMMIEQRLSLRPGVLRLIGYAKDNDIQVGLASTMSRNTINAMFEALDGALHRRTFNFVGDGDVTTAPKPDPEIYNRAMAQMNVTAKQCVAIEDSAVSLRAAQAAGISCIAFPGIYAGNDDFGDAFRIIDQLSPDMLPKIMQLK